jgi:hypothetical protein
MKGLDLVVPVILQQSLHDLVVPVILQQSLHDLVVPVILQQSLQQFTTNMEFRDLSYTQLALGAHTENSYFSSPAG